MQLDLGFAAAQDTALLFDTETTGVHEPEVIEAAWLRLHDPESLRVIDRFEQRYRPSKPIALGALATHHIYDEELQDCPPSTEFALPGDASYLIGHNIDYDWKVAGAPEVKRICTLALSRALHPELDSHSQSAMLYFAYRPQAREWVRNAHSALVDVENCLQLLRYLLNKLAEQHGPITSWEALWQLSEQARIPHTMPFGKHRGEPIAQLPSDYVGWLLRQSDLDPYLVKALQAR